MNKWIAVPCITLVLLGGCTPPSSSPHQSPVDMHTAMNALDYMGTYRAETPVAKGDFRAIELKADRQFRLLTARHEEKTGPYHWDKSGSVVQLALPDGSKPRFFVGEGFLRRETSTGNTGQILRKE